MKQNGWKVYLGNLLLDYVYYSTDCDIEYVRDSLINHDGYSSNIVVVGPFAL